MLSKKDGETEKTNKQTNKGAEKINSGLTKRFCMIDCRWLLSKTRP